MVKSFDIDLISCSVMQLPCCFLGGAVWLELIYSRAKQTLIRDLSSSCTHRGDRAVHPAITTSCCSARVLLSALPCWGPPERCHVRHRSSMALLQEEAVETWLWQQERKGGWGGELVHIFIGLPTAKWIRKAEMLSCSYIRDRDSQMVSCPWKSVTVQTLCFVAFSFFLSSVFLSLRHFYYEKQNCLTEESQSGLILAWYLGDCTPVNHLSNVVQVLKQLWPVEAPTPQELRQRTSASHAQLYNHQGNLSQWRGWGWGGGFQVGRVRSKWKPGPSSLTEFTSASQQHHASCCHLLCRLLMSVHPHDVSWFHLL